MTGWCLCCPIYPENIKSVVCYSTQFEFHYTEYVVLRTNGESFADLILHTPILSPSVRPLSLCVSGKIRCMHWTPYLRARLI